MATTYQSDNYQVERPVHNHQTATFRSTNINNTSNSGITINTVLDKIVNLQRLLKEVYIRFDTNPQYYQKNDYKVLLDYIAKLTGATETLNLITQKINKEAVEDNIVTFNDKGEIKDSGKHIGTSIISNNPDADTVATELAVSNKITNTPQIKWVTYGESKYNDCISAYNKHYIVACYYNNLLYIMENQPVSNYISFKAFVQPSGSTGSDVTTIHYFLYLMNDDTWSNHSIQFDTSMKANQTDMNAVQDLLTLKSIS